MSRPRKYPEELLERGVRLALESGRPIAHVAADDRIHSETLRKRVRQAEADQGLRPDLPTSEEREEIKRLRQENFELRRANEYLEVGERIFRQGARLRPTEVSRCIEEHRGRFGVEPICKTLGVSVSAYYQRRGVAARGGRSRTNGSLPGAARGQLLRLRLPADVESASACRRASAALPRVTSDEKQRSCLPSRAKPSEADQIARQRGRGALQLLGANLGPRLESGDQR
jgi:transposase